MKNRSICTIKSCRNYNKYCRLHASSFVKESDPIKKESKKRALINRNEYAPKAALFIKDHPSCQIKSPECTGKSQCVHHRKGKSSMELLLDEKYWMASCFRCNNYIENSDLYARQNGFKLSKFSPQNK